MPTPQKLQQKHTKATQKVGGSAKKPVTKAMEGGKGNVASVKSKAATRGAGSARGGSVKISTTKPRQHIGGGGSIKKPAVTKAMEGGSAKKPVTKVTGGGKVTLAKDKTARGGNNTKKRTVTKSVGGDGDNDIGSVSFTTNVDNLLYNPVYISRNPEFENYDIDKVRSSLKAFISYYYKNIRKFKKCVQERRTVYHKNATSFSRPSVHKNNVIRTAIINCPEKFQKYVNRETNKDLKKYIIKTWLSPDYETDYTNYTFSANDILNEEKDAYKNDRINEICGTEPNTPEYNTCKNEKYTISYIPKVGKPKINNIGNTVGNSVDAGKFYPVAPPPRNNRYPSEK
jgi:hypothetical protein